MNDGIDDTLASVGATVALHEISWPLQNYSMHGHVESLAGTVVEGAPTVPGVEAAIKRVPELMSEEAARKVGAKSKQAAPIATPSGLAEYDGIVFGTPTRFGNMAAQMRNFLD